MGGKGREAEEDEASGEMKKAGNRLSLLRREERIRKDLGREVRRTHC